MIKHLIFDFDGVIADTFDINQALSFEHDPTATAEDFLAHHDGNVFAEPRIKFKPERVHLFYSEYSKRLKPSHLSLSIDPLQRLAEKYSLYIISSTGEEAIKGILKQVDILKLFAKVLGQDTHKSKLEKFKILMDQYGINPENSIFITDTLGDIKEANQVGIRTIGETFGFHPRERLALGNPFKIVDSWIEIESLLKELS